MHALAVLSQHGQIDLAGTLALPFAVQCRHSSSGNQTAETAIGGAIDRIGQEFEPFDRLDPAPDHRTQTQRAGFGMKPHHPGHAVGIGNAQRVIAQAARRRGEVHCIGSPAQERKT